MLTFAQSDPDVAVVDGSAMLQGPGPVGPGPCLVALVAYRFCGQMKVLQLAKKVRELSPMNSVAE
jgi:hypothetical protein